MKTTKPTSLLKAICMLVIPSGVEGSQRIILPALLLLANLALAQLPDSDLDGFADELEALHGTDPSSAESRPTLADNHDLLSAHWPLQENADDNFISSITGTLHGGAEFRGGALHLNGKTGYVDFGNSDTLSSSNGIAWSVWVKPEKHYGLSRVMGKFVSSEREYACFILGGRLWTYVSDNGTSRRGHSLIGVTRGRVVQRGEWAHIAVSWETDDIIKVFINGEEQQTWNCGHRLLSSLYSGSAPLTLGAYDVSERQLRRSGRKLKSVRNSFSGEITGLTLFSGGIEPVEARELWSLGRSGNLSAYIAADSDEDGLPDWWERLFFGDVSQDASTDSDGDGLTNAQELERGFDPSTDSSGIDTDADGMSDVWEIIYGLNPDDAQDALLDTDGDGITNLEEFVGGHDPTVADNPNDNDRDSDEDGLPDAWERRYSGDDASMDHIGDEDADGLVNIFEYRFGTDPTVADSDSDGVGDLAEWLEGSVDQEYDLQSRAVFPAFGSRLLDGYQRVMLSVPVEVVRNSPLDRFYLSSSPFELAGWTDVSEVGFNIGRIDPNTTSLFPDHALNISGLVPYGTNVVEMFLLKHRHADPYNQRTYRLSEDVYLIKWTASLDVTWPDYGEGEDVYIGAENFRDLDISLRGKVKEGYGIWLSLLSSGIDESAVQFFDQETRISRFRLSSSNLTEHLDVKGMRASASQNDDALFICNYDSVLTQKVFTVFDVDIEDGPSVINDGYVYFGNIGVRLLPEDAGEVGELFLGAQDQVVKDADNATVEFGYHEFDAADTYGWPLYLSELTAEWTVHGHTVYDSFLEDECEEIGMSLVADYDNDGDIDSDDSEKSIKGETFYFWINDDNDFSDLDGNDIPGQPGSKNDMLDPDTADHADLWVDGSRDLLDFFPLWLNVGEIIYDLPPSDYEYVIRHYEGAVNVLETDLCAGASATDRKANAYLRNIETMKEYSEAQLIPVDSDGFVLSEAFLQSIEDQTGGILLVEGKKETADSLYLEIRTKSDGITIAEVGFAMRLSGVESMFRHVTLVGVLGEGESPAIETPTRRSCPGLPDTQCGSNHFVFVHGYNVSQQAARGWQSEMFKRLYRAGSRARFTAVTWHGDTGKNYHKAVINAFVSSEYLDDALQMEGGEVTIAAHSLGNMLVSSAIKDHGLQPDRYFLVNAAVPIEAYDSLQTHVSSDGQSIGMATNMCNPEWRDYERRLWASSWHELFKDGRLDADGNPVYSDSRQNLTWRDRFGHLGGIAYNFYSPGEDVVKNGEGVMPSTLFDVWWEGGKYAWVKQEMIKGLVGAGGLLSKILPDQHGGWGFNETYDANSLLLGHQRYKNADTLAITDGMLRIEPFFRCFIEKTEKDTIRFPNYSGKALLAPLGNTNAIAQAGLEETQYKILAEAIPAVSFAAAANSIKDFDDVAGGQTRNFNLQALTNRGEAWPEARADTAWKHSDIRDIPYSYNYELYDKIVQEGVLDAE